MSKKRGRPPKVTPFPPREPDFPLSPESRAFEALYPPDRTKVTCVLCHEDVEDIAPHLEDRHPTVRLEDYAIQFPSAPVRGEQKPQKEREIRVSAAEAEAHPGKREGAMIEKQIDPKERAAYRDDIEALIKQGHEPSRAVASIAHTMVLARRARAQVEKARERTDGEFLAADHLNILHDLEEQIGRGLLNLEKIRATRAKDVGEDPLGVINGELDQAELWVQAHIGEFMERCPGCGLMLTAPALPHWAYQPLTTEHGVQWPVWSPELWSMVLDRTIPLWIMAFTLRTSPEGLKFTAQKRKTDWPDWIDIEEQERLLRVQLDRQDREATTPLLALAATNERTGGEDDAAGR